MDRTTARRAARRGARQQSQSNTTVAPPGPCTNTIGRRFTPASYGERRSFCVDRRSTAYYGQPPEKRLSVLGLPADLISQAATEVQDSPLYGLVAGHIAQLTADADALSADPAAALSGCTGIELIRGPAVVGGQRQRQQLRRADRRHPAVPGSRLRPARPGRPWPRRRTDRQSAQHVGPAAVQSLRERGIQPRTVDHQPAAGAGARRSGAFTPPTDSRPGNGAGSRSPRTSRSGQPRSGVLACLPARASRPSIASSDSQSVAFCA